MCILKSGLFGISLQLQCYTIASVQTVSSLILSIVAITMLHQPENFVSDWVNVKKSDTFRNYAINEVGENGIELFIGSVTLLIGAIMLILGLRRHSTGLILPWIVINIVDFCGGVIIFISKLASPKVLVRPIKVLAVICYFCLVVYFVATVYSYYQSVKRQKRIARLVLQSNMTLSSDASGLDRHDDFRVVSNTELHTFPSSRPRSLNLSEINSSDDDEFILYVQ